MARTPSPPIVIIDSETLLPKRIIVSNEAFMDMFQPSDCTLQILDHQSFDKYVYGIVAVVNRLEIATGMDVETIKEWSEMYDETV